MLWGVVETLNLLTKVEMNSPVDDNYVLGRGNTPGNKYRPNTSCLSCSFSCTNPCIIPL